MAEKKVSPIELLSSLEEKCWEAAQEQGARNLEDWVLLQPDIEWIAESFGDYFDRLPTAQEWKCILDAAPHGLSHKEESDQ